MLSLNYTTLISIAVSCTLYCISIFPKSQTLVTKGCFHLNPQCKNLYLKLIYAIWDLFRTLFAHFGLHWLVLLIYLIHLKCQLSTIVHSTFSIQLMVANLAIIFVHYQLAHFEHYLVKLHMYLLIARLWYSFWLFTSVCLDLGSCNMYCLVFLFCNVMYSLFAYQYY